MLSQLDIALGALTYDASTAASHLTISATEGVYTFTDTDQTITLGPGATDWSLNVDGHTATGPVTSVTKVITVSGGDSSGNGLTIDFTGGDPFNSYGLTYNPTAAAAGASNSLTLQGGSFTNEVFTSTAAGAGNLVYSSSTTIRFTNLSSFNSTVPSPAFMFNSRSGPETVNIISGPTIGGFNTTQVNDGGGGDFGVLNIANTTTATVNTRAYGDTITVNDTALGAALTTLYINTNGGSDTINIRSTPAGLTTYADTGNGTIDTTNVGQSGSLTGILGPIFARSAGGSGTLNVDDSADSAARIFNISGTQVTGSALAVTIDYAGGGITSLGVKKGPQDDTFNVSGFGGASSVTSFNINGGAGFDTLNVSSSLAGLNYLTPGVLSTGDGTSAINYSNVEAMQINKASSAPLGTGRTISISDTLSFSNITVGTFVESDPGATADNFVATIDWGDGTPSAYGSIVPTGPANLSGITTFDIRSAHVYARAGIFAVSVTLTNRGTSGFNSVGAVTVSVSAQGPVSSDPNPISSTAVVDLAAPVARLNKLGKVKRGKSPFRFSVTYSDDFGLDWSSIGPRDIIVTGPKGFKQYVKFKSKVAGLAGTYTATYEIAPPKKAWNSAANGNYTIWLEANQVRDRLGKAAKKTKLGLLKVKC